MHRGMRTSKDYGEDDVVQIDEQERGRKGIKGTMTVMNMVRLVLLV